MGKGGTPATGTESGFKGRAPADPAQLGAVLDNLQGNILVGHGRDHTVHIFFDFDRTGIARSRDGVMAVAERVVTSARTQMEETRLYNEFKIPGSPFGNLFLSAEGYRSLGFTDAQLGQLFPEGEANEPTKSTFKKGMRQFGAADFADPPPAKWDPGYTRGRVDGMILLADDDRAFLHRRARELVTELQGFATVLQVELGDALRNDDGEAIEHFGYVDGRSQPLFLTTDFVVQDGVVTEKGGGRIDKWNPVEPLDLVLVDDKAAGAADCKGSYFVFRKLEQDVRRFKIREQALADKLGLEDEDQERAGAMAVGRFEDGTPLTLSRTDGFAPAKENNFTYAADDKGGKCPFHAHIRKTNPRGDIPRTLGDQGPPPNETPDERAFRQSLSPLERPRRVTRRGITYGQREQHPSRIQSLDALPTKDVGLLFMCFQASIPRQFAFMQNSWANNEQFVTGIGGGAGPGVDPVIGQVATPVTTPGTPTANPQTWIREWDDASGNPASEKFSFAQFVTLKGGEFFFAPSLPFLRTLTAPAVHPPAAPTAAP